MVFVSVRDDDAAHAAFVLHEIGYVGDNKVYARHILSRESKPGVDYDNVFAVFERGHIFAYFAHSAQKSHFKRFVRLAVLFFVRLCFFGRFGGV